ncbi:NnrS family protein [Staphylococcus epidermidis]|nr:NnrS family protein [Staphylococcus epidermidis]
MSELLQIDEPAGSAPQAKLLRPSGKPYGAWLGPLYMAGCLWAVVSVALWVFAPQWLAGRLGGVQWHAHEMPGPCGDDCCGLSAHSGQQWTGRNPIEGRVLGCLCFLWLLARVGFLVVIPLLPLL